VFKFKYRLSYDGLYKQGGDMTHVSDINSVDGAEHAVYAGGHSLQTLLTMMLMEKIDNTDKQTRKEVDILTDRQKRVEFLNKYLRAVNSNTSTKNGTVKTETLEEIRAEGLQLLEDADSRKAKAEELRGQVEQLKSSDEDHAAEIADMEKEISWLEESAEEIYTTLQACDIIDEEKNPVTPPKKYTDPVRGKIIENIRSYSKMLQSRNNYQSQVVSRLNNERHEVLMLAKDMSRSLHEILKKMASNIKG
jgi:hypothetical protein